MPLEKGSKLGNYEIQAILGAGGMGEVYHARDMRLDRDVAVKVLPRKFAENDGALRRFEREAKAVAALAHPNILAIYDFGNVDGSPYAAMELLEGRTLRDYLVDGALPPRKAAALARQVADGLGAAHDRQIVHRDLKPENIFITDDGRAKILDFGLAADRSDALGVGANDVETNSPTVGRSLTDPGTVLGTVGYMAPEQVRGERADHRSDIFSFGCVLYEMLGGRRAFKRDTPAETMTAVLREDPEGLDSLPSSISPALDRVVRRCLEKNPEERFQSMRDLAFAIDNAVSASDSGARSNGAEFGSEVEAGGRTRPTFGWPALAAAAVVGLVVGFFVFRGGGSTDVAVPEPPRMHTLTVSGSDVEPSASPDGSIIAFRSVRDGKSRIWLKQLVGGGEQPLTDGPDELPKFSPDGSALLFIRDEGGVRSVYRQSMLGGQTRRVVQGDEAAWAPDGERIAFIRLGGVGGERSALIGVCDVSGTREEILYEATRTISSLSWSADGRWIVAVGSSLTGNNPDTGLVMIDAVSHDVRYADPSGLGFPMSGITWTADGDMILAIAGALLGDQGDRTSRFVRYDMETDRVTTLFWSQDLFPIQGLRVNGTLSDIVAPGTMVYHKTFGRQGLREVTLEGSHDPRDGRVLTHTDGRDRQPVYSPKGRWVMFSSTRTGNLDLWKIDTQTKQVRQLTDDAAQDWDPGFSPDGRQIVWSSDRGGHLEIWAANADGSGARQLTDDGADAENPTFTPDGEWVAYWSSNPDKLGVWKIRSDGSDATLLVAGAYLQPEVSPDGKYAAYLFQELEKTRTLINVVEIETRTVVPFQIVVPIPQSSGNIIFGRLRWLPDGSALAFVGADEKNRTGIFAQDFVPGEDTRNTLRKLAGFSSDYMTESFGVSLDGTRLTLATLELTSQLMLVDGVADIRPPR